MSNRRVIRVSSLLLLTLLLASCYLVSGERIEEGPPLALQEPGWYDVQFVSADGVGHRTIDTGIPNAPLAVGLSAQTVGGELTVQLLDEREDSAITVTARLGVASRGQATVRADAEGKLTLRITAIEARGGSYSVSYLLLLPTPTPTATPEPTTQPGP